MEGRGASNATNWIHLYPNQDSLTSVLGLAFLEKNRASKAHVPDSNCCQYGGPWSTCHQLCHHPHEPHWVSTWRENPLQFGSKSKRANLKTDLESSKWEDSRGQLLPISPTVGDVYCMKKSNLNDNKLCKSTSKSAGRELWSGTMLGLDFRLPFFG